MRERGVRIGIDLGGTKTEGIVLAGDGDVGLRGFGASANKR
jgi:N-acetylglucosamine kinase-like BadF-type ATPase